MVALLKEESIRRRPDPMPSLAPRLRLVPTDQSPLRLDLETPPDMADLTHPDGSALARPDDQVGQFDELDFDLAAKDLPAQDLPAKDLPAKEDLPICTPMFAIVTALVILALLSFVRISQGAPPASSWDSLAPVPAVATAPGAGETVRVVDAGDTLWAIAGEIAPDADRRLVVDALAQRNGGSGLQAGQVLVIPENLVRS